MRRNNYSDSYIVIPAVSLGSCLSVIFDIFMALITCGLWIIVIVIRDSGRRKKQNRRPVF